MESVLSSIIGLSVGLIFGKVSFIYEKIKEKNEFKKFKNYGNYKLSEIVKELDSYIQENKEITSTSVHNLECLNRSLPDKIDEKLEVMNYYIKNKDVLIENKKNKIYWLIYIEKYQLLIDEYKSILLSYTFHDTRAYIDLSVEELEKYYFFEVEKLEKLRLELIERNKQFDILIKNYYSPLKKPTWYFQIGHAPKLIFDYDIDYGLLVINDNQWILNFSKSYIINVFNVIR